MRPQHDCCAANGLCWEDDTWTTRSPLSQHDHRVLRSQMPSGAPTNNREELHGRESPPPVPGRAHGHDQLIWFSPRLDTRSIPRSVLVPIGRTRHSQIDPTIGDLSLLGKRNVLQLDINNITTHSTMTLTTIIISPPLPHVTHLLMTLRVMTPHMTRTVG